MFGRTETFDIEVEKVSSGGNVGDRTPPPSNNNQLKNLDIRLGEESFINFDPEQTEYNVEVDEIELQIEASDSKASIAVNGENVAGNTIITLEEGEKIFNIVITAENGDTREYTVTIQRLQEVPFPDIEDHWAKDYIKTAYRNDWFQGFPDGTFQPDSNVTRIQTASLFVRI